MCHVPPHDPLPADKRYFTIFAPMISGESQLMMARTFAGLEQALAQELRDLGAADVNIQSRAVTFRGNMALLYKVNLHVRTALRIVLPLDEFTGVHPDQLYERASKINWSDFITYRDTFYVDAMVSGEFFLNSHYCALRVKDAINDHFRATSGVKRPAFQQEKPDMRVMVNITDTEVQFGIDTSGDALSRRGYRAGKSAVAVNEALAAGLVLLSGWKGETAFLDPMCGAGTLLIEAASIATNTAPGLRRNYFAFQSWKNFDERLWRSLLKEAKAAQKPLSVPMNGATDTLEAVDIARQCVTRAGFLGSVQVAARPYHKLEKTAEKGALFTNLPEPKDATPEIVFDQFSEFGKWLIQRFTGWDAWLYSDSVEGLKNIGLRPTQKFFFRTGETETRCFRFPVRMQEQAAEEGTGGIRQF